MSPSILWCTKQLRVHYYFVWLSLTIAYVELRANIHKQTCYQNYECTCHQERNIGNISEVTLQVL